MADPSAFAVEATPEAATATEAAKDEPKAAEEEEEEEEDEVCSKFFHTPWSGNIAALCSKINSFPSESCTVLCT